LTLDRVDACYHNAKGKAYFFRGNQYWRYDIAADSFGAGFPKPIAGNWTGPFPADIDGVINHGNGKAYFFRGSEHLRYDLTADKADAGYPLPIAGNWPGVFASGVRAPVILGYAGFDRLGYPGDATMTALWATDLRWCGFYLAPAPSQGNTSWMAKRAFLTGLGNRPSLRRRTATRAEANPRVAQPFGGERNRGRKQRSGPRQHGGLSGGPYYLSRHRKRRPHQERVEGLLPELGEPGRRTRFPARRVCSFLLTREFRALDARTVFWSWNLNRLPSGADKIFQPPLPAPPPNFAEIEFLTLWQLSQGVDLELPKGLLSN
jgi:hypothetical protein